MILNKKDEDHGGRDDEGEKMENKKDFVLFLFFKIFF